MIQREKDSWELGTDISADKLVEKATTKYNNMVLQNIWNQTDAKDAKILALTTKVELLTTAFSTATAAASSSSTTNKNTRKKYVPEEWLITNVGPSIERDGKTLYWCPHHKGPQKDWPGMYMPHKPEDHHLWQEAKDLKYPRKKKKKNVWSVDSTVILR